MMYYVATGEANGSYAFLKDQRLNFAYDIPYPTGAHPVELVMKGWDVTLHYKLGGG